MAINPNSRFLRLNQNDRRDMDNNIASFPAPSAQPKALPKLLKPVDAAKVLEVDHRTLVRWARLGYVPAHPMGQGKGRRRMWRFYEHELIAWANAQTNDVVFASGRAA
jgi:Helix-turn-helix domain